MKWRRDARDKRHFIIMSAVAALVLVIGLFFDQTENRQWKQAVRRQ